MAKTMEHSVHFEASDKRLSIIKKLNELQSNMGDVLKLTTLCYSHCLKRTLVQS